MRKERRVMKKLVGVLMGLVLASVASAVIVSPQAYWSFEGDSGDYGAGSNGNPAWVEKGSGTAPNYIGSTSAPAWPEITTDGVKGDAFYATDSTKSSQKTMTLNWTAGVQDVFSSVESYTVCGWINTRDAGKDGSDTYLLKSWSAGPTLKWRGDGRLQFMDSVDGSWRYTGWSDTDSKGDWVFFGITRDSSSINFYVGSEGSAVAAISTGTATGLTLGATGTSDRFVIGGYTYNGTDNYAGFDMDELRIYSAATGDDGALSLSQLEEIRQFDLLSEPPPRSIPGALRLFSYNIFTGLAEGGDGGGMVSMNRIADVIAASNPDLVALQEVDKYTTRGNIDQAKVLGELLGMEYRFMKNEDYRGGEYGIALLSRYPIQATYEHALPPNGGENRGALEVVVEVSDLYGRTNTLSFVSTHLDHLSDETRVLQVQAILDALAPRNHPIVLAGDLNALPTSDPTALLESNGYAPLGPSSAFTFPAVIPNRKIDYIMVKDLPISESRFTVVFETLASDHRPILAEAGLGAPADWLGQYGILPEALSNFLDSDGDTMDNYSEWLTGTNPTNALSFFGFQSLGSGPVPTGFKLQWNSIAGRTYRVEASTNLVDGVFQPLESGIQGVEGTTEYIDTSATGDQVFYRVFVE